MTKHDFITAHRDRLAGLLLDAITAGRSGAEAMVWLRQAMKKIDLELSQAYDALVPDLPLPVNGRKMP